MLLCLLSAFALSQAYRTVTAIMATGLQHDFGLSAASLGAFAGLFGLSFGVTQFVMGIGMDVVGLRRTVLSAFPLTVIGAALSALAPHYRWLMLGQLLIGVGCAPAFLACTVFISRHFPSHRFAFMSGVGLGVGSLGLLFTGTPLAWLVQHTGWRSGFWLLALLLLPHTLGIVLLGMVGYASFLALRGLWIGPMLIERYHFTLVETGNMVVAMSLISVFSPVLFGRFDPGPARRRAWVANLSLLVAALYLALGLFQHLELNLVLMLCIAVLTGYAVLQYSDVRSSYPPDLTGRALSVYTMAMFLGAGLMQTFTGWVADWAQNQGWEPYRAVMAAIALLLASGSAAFRFLPASPLLRRHGPQDYGSTKN